MSHLFSRFRQVTICTTLGLGLLSLAACSDTEAPVTMSGVSGSAGQAQAGSGGAGTAGGSGGNGGNANAGSNAMAGSGGAAGGSAGGGAGGGAGGAAGGGGAAGAGGAGGQPAYNPCPTNGDPCRIMPLGDSITDGGGSLNASYRVELFHLANINGKNLTFVGSHESGPDMVDNKPFPKKTEGHSGWTIDDGGGREGLYPEMQGWLTNTPPDIVTLMIGTNDIDIQLDVDNAPMRLGLLLDRIAMYAPNALIVLAQMVPTTDDTENQRVQAYNAAMPALVKARADAGKHVVLVDMYGAFTANANYKTEFMNDKLHPKDAGLAVMAGVWYAAIGSLLPAAQ